MRHPEPTLVIGFVIYSIHSSLSPNKKVPGTLHQIISVGYVKFAMHLKKCMAKWAYRSEGEG
jgi:hypothetical protein